MSSAEGFLTIHHTCVTTARNETQDISFLSGRALVPCQPVAPPRSHTFAGSGTSRNGIVQRVLLRLAAFAPRGGFEIHCYYNVTRESIPFSRRTLCSCVTVTIDRRLACWRGSGAVEKAAVNLLVPSVLWTNAFTAPGYIPGNGIAPSWGKDMCSNS